jgi:2'-5' RNA ligase
MSDRDRIRAFLAIPASDAWVVSARDFVGMSKPDFPDASWTTPASWHLTLLFLGEVPSDGLRRFVDGVSPIVRGCPEGLLPSGDAVVFPSHGPARVLSVGFAQSEITAALVRLSEEAHTVAVGCLPASQLARHKPFHPHVTLARVRRPWPRPSVDAFRQRVAEWKLPDWPVRRCVLYQSRLEQEGAVHTPLEEWPLGDDRDRAHA